MVSVRGIKWCWNSEEEEIASGWETSGKVIEEWVQ